MFKVWIGGWRSLSIAWLYRGHATSYLCPLIVGSRSGYEQTIIKFDKLGDRGKPVLATEMSIEVEEIYRP